MQRFKSGLLAIAATFIAGSALAQTDPKLTATVVSELSPNEVTLSRSLGSPAEFIGRAAWRVTIKNGAANVLNRASFTAETFVVAADSDLAVTGATAPIDITVGGSLATTDVIHVDGTAEHCKLVTGSTTKLACDFTDSQLAVGEGAVFIIVAKSPTAGSRIKLEWSFGGDEGKGGGNGCCTTVSKTYTGLIDAAANSSVKTHVQSFMVTTATVNKAFTGINGGVATAADPWTTVANLGTGYKVNGIEQSYTKITVDEQSNPAVLASCSALNKNQCWVSQVSIPFTTWTLASPLLINVNRHSSIIKNGSKLANYVITYSKTGMQPFTPLSSCSPAVPPLPGTPCLEICEEIPLPTQPPTFVWSCNVKALDNGSYAAE